MFRNFLLRQARSSRPLLLLTIGLGFAASALTLLQAGVLSRVISQVFLAGWSLERAAGLLAVFAGVAALRAGLLWGSETAAGALAVRIKAGLRRQLFQHILELGPAFTRGERTGELTNAAVEGIEALDAYYRQYLPQLALAALVPLTFLVFVFPLDPLSGLVLLLTAPLIPVFMILIGSAAKALTRRQWQSLSRMSAYFLDVLQGITALKLLGRSRAQISNIARVSERFRQTTMSVLRVTFLSALALEMVATLSTAVVAVEVGLRLLYGRLAFEQAFFVLLLAPEFYLPLRLLGTRFHAGMAGVEAAKRIAEVLEISGRRCSSPTRSSVSSQQVPVTSHQSPVTPSPAITFDNITYSYGDSPALKDVSFSIQPGQRVALVGPSGAGKSTVAALLLRFIHPAGGQIEAGGRPLEVLSPQEWRRRVAWAPQNPYLFYGTVAENIRLARPEASLEEVVRAARLANADEFIRSFPKGYDTPVGEHGARLSGGQAQRISLARAFLQDAPFVLLDEPSANLDPENEALLQQALERLLAGRTALIIAHRVNTVLHADHILVLDDGEVVESGDHRSLLEKGGLYSRLINAGLPTAPPPSSSTYISPVPPPPLFTPLSAEIPRELPGERKHLPPLFRLLAFVVPYSKWVALSVLAGFATIGSSIGLMAASAYIISAAALQPSIAELQVAIVAVRFFGISRGLFRYLERFLSHQVTFRLLARLRVWFYTALEPLAPARLMSYRSGDLLARILGDIDSLESFYVRGLAPPLTALLVSLAAGAYLASFDTSLAIILLAFLAAAGVGAPGAACLLGREAGRQVVERSAALNASLVDGIQGLPELLAAGQGQRQLECIEGLSRGLGQAQQRLASLGGLQSALESLLASLGMGAVLAAAIPLVSSGQMVGVYLAVLALAALASFEAVQPLPQAAQQLESNLQAARRLFEVVDTQPEVVDPPEPLPPPDGLRLEVQHLSFKYPPFSISGQPEGFASKDGFSLQDISFTLSPGKRLAIVGPSGSGKSTLAHLLLRFWEHRQGTILLNGSDLRCYRQDDVRRLAAVVAQNTSLFNASLRDNLLLTRPDADPKAIDRAAAGAQLFDWVHSLPDGYGTWVGEGGLRLSAGERQRVSIARALLKDAPLLVLDEPTANLDTLTEREVLRAIHTLMEGRATLLITHRLVGMEWMDEILVLRGGRVIERGRHAGLLARGGEYCRMWELQNQALREDV